MAQRLGARAAQRGAARPQRSIESLRTESARHLGLLLAVGVGAVTTAVFVTNPSLRVVHQRPALDVQIATAAVLVALLVAMLASGRYRRCAVGRDASLAWGTTLLAFAWFGYLLAPSISADIFYVGDALALIAYLLLAFGAVAEVRAYQQNRARLAAAEERGRVARELHDGVAQELVHVLGRARRLHARTPGPDTERLLSAAERALDESRTAISTLRAPLDEPLHAALERTAGELGRRLELDVRVRADHSVDVAPPVREAVMRIVGEALANAARHGGAQTAAIELRDDGERPRLTVHDDGCGFDPDADRIPSGSFGLVSMRERAASFGGWVTIHSAPGDGTTVEVALP